MSTKPTIRSGISMLVTLFIAGSVLTSLGAAEYPQVMPYREDFEDGEAQGWDLEPGWQIQLEGANHVLAGEGHFWARAGGSSDGDLTQSFRVKLVKGRIHFVVRLSDAARYYIGFDGGRTDLNKQYFPSDFHEGLARLQAVHAPDRWYQIQIVLQGRTIELLVDGTRQWSYEDPEPLDSGSFAFETVENSLAYVDDIAIDIPSAAPPAAPAATAAPATSAPAAAPPAAASLTWVRTGGPLGGLGYDIRMRQDNLDRMFVSDAWAGVFASNDGGLSWFPSSSGITTRTGPSGDAIPVFSLTIDPNDPQIVWAGTQFQRGIFRSVDGGQTWQKRDAGVVENEGITFRGFTVQPGDSNVVYAAAEISSWAWSPDHREQRGREFDRTRGAIYKTTDGGQSWKAVWRGGNLARYIWINPQNTDVLYISTGFFDREAANSDPVQGTPGGEGILKSTDGGRTWQAVNNGLQNLYFTSLFMHPSDPDTLLAAGGNIQYRTGGGVYLTTDGGASWTRTLTSSNSVFECVEFSSSDPSIAYAGSDSEIFRSQDGGRNWTRVSGGEYWGSPGVRAGFPIDFQVDPRDPNRVFANEYGGGNFLSEDGGKTWVDVSQGYTGAQVRDIAVNQAASGPVIAAARSGLFASYDGGTKWIGLSNPPAVSMEWNAVAIDPAAPQHVLAATNWNGLLSSEDSGKTWMLSAPMLSNRIGWRAIAFAPSDPSTAYAGSAGYYSAGQFDPSIAAQGIYASHDGGRSWNAANAGPSQDAHVASLAVHPSDAATVLAATTNHGVLRTTDGGQQWKAVGRGIGALSVAFDPSDPSIAFAGFDRGGLYRSTDGGKSWQRSNSGMSPEASVSDIVFDPTNPGAVLYASVLQSGVYRSTDGGRTWTAIIAGLQSRAVNALAITSDGLHLYAATEGSGTFRLDLNGQPPESVAAPQVAATATSYQYKGATATPIPSASKPGGSLPFCGSAALPLGLITVGLWWRRRR